MKRMGVILALVLGWTVQAEACQQYRDIMQDIKGNAIASVSILVQKYWNGTTAAATIYSDSNCTVALTNPATSDGTGIFSFYVNDGVYQIVPTKSGYAFNTVSDISIFEPGVVASTAVADQTITAATTAYLTNSSIAVPFRKLRIGSVVTWRLAVSKTAAGSAANSFLVKIGTAGTTADTSVLTFSLPVGTAAVDSAFITIMMTVRGPLSASGLLQGHLQLTHNLDATGFATIGTVDLDVLSSAFNVTTANLIVGLACTTAASTVLTFTQVSADARNL